MHGGRRWLWVSVRLAVVLWLALRGLNPPRGIVLLGPQRQVRSINPKIGVHTRLTDEVEEWKIKRSLELVREMGASWIIEYFPWAYSEPEPGVYSWEHADMVIAHARRQGLRVIARIGFVPDWARPEGSAHTYLAPERYEQLALFCAAFVERYAEAVDHLIVWNEPNLALEWGYRAPDPAEYAHMLRTVYLKVKATRPEVQILGGALSPTLGAPAVTGGVPDAIDDLVYLQAMYDAGAAPFFDVLAVHAYGWRFPANADPDPATINFRRAELLREIMVRNGDAHKRAMITEGGWNDHPRWTKSVRPGQRVAYTLGAYEWALQQWEWCAVVGLWAFRFPRPMGGYLDYFAFVTVDLTLKPVYVQVQRYARGEDVGEWLMDGP
jgi:hypothetical protein